MYGLLLQFAEDKTAVQRQRRAEKNHGPGCENDVKVRSKSKKIEDLKNSQNLNLSVQPSKQ